MVTTGAFMFFYVHITKYWAFRVCKKAFLSVRLCYTIENLVVGHNQVQRYKYMYECMYDNMKNSSLVVKTEILTNEYPADRERTDTHLMLLMKTAHLKVCCL